MLPTTAKVPVTRKAASLHPRLVAVSAPDTLIVFHAGIKYDSNCENKEILVAIDKAIRSSLQLRSKKELIEHFIDTINADTDVDSDWSEFVREQRETDIAQLIQTEKLKPEETRKLMDKAFRDGILKTTGTDVDQILPPVSRFSGGGKRVQKKQTVIKKLKAIFEKYFGLFGAEDHIAQE